MGTIKPVCYLVGIRTVDGLTIVGPFASRNASEDWAEDYLRPLLTDAQADGLLFTQMLSVDEVAPHLLEPPS